MSGPPGNVRICAVTTVHRPFDARIFHKELGSLSEAGFRCTLIAPHDSAATVEGIEIVPVPRYGNRLRRLLFGPFAAWRLARSGGYGIIILHDPELIPAGMLLRLSGRRKVVFDAHEEYRANIREKHWLPAPLRGVTAALYSLMDAAAARLFDAVIYPTEAVGANYVRARRRLLVRNYPLARLFPEPDPSERRPEFIYSGSISVNRGLWPLLHGFRILAGHRPEARLTLLGWFRPASLQAEVRARLAEWGLSDRVELISTGLPHEEAVLRLYGCAAGMATLLPTPAYLAALPTKLFEYMLAGLPVIATDMPMHASVLAGTGTGVLVSTDEPEGIAEAMQGILEDPERVAAMGRRARETALAQYSWESEGEGLVRLCRELAEG